MATSRDAARSHRLTTNCRLPVLTSMPSAFHRQGMICSRFVGAVLMAFAGAIFIVPPVLAGGVVGTGTPASCTEDALDRALLQGGTVTFNCGASAVTITVTRAKPIDFVDTTIDGGGLITLNGGNSVQVFSVGGVKFAVQNLSITNGYARGPSYSGGAIENGGTVTVSTCTFSGNRAEFGGGAIENYGTLTVTNSTFSGNTVTPSPGAANVGGGAIENTAIENSSPTLSVRDCTFSSNSATDGGGILVNSGSADITSSTFSNNSANTGEGGAINNQVTAALTVTTSTFSDNTSNPGDGGGIHNDGSLTVTASRFSGNSAGHGGGIYNNGSLTVTTSTFSGNQTDGGSGGGIFNFGSLAVIASTFAGNHAEGIWGGAIFTNTFGSRVSVSNCTFSENRAGYGGGILNENGDMTITNCTLSLNGASFGGTGGAIWNGGSLSVKNTIVANSVGPNCGTDEFGIGQIIADSTNNLDDDRSCAFLAPGRFATTFRAGLSLLGNNGGPTQTIQLLPGSDAIDAGDITTCSNPPINDIDQRGFSRFPTGDPECDVGALEAGSSSPPLSPDTPTATRTPPPTGTATATPSGPTGTPTPTAVWGCCSVLGGLCVLEDGRYCQSPAATFVPGGLCSANGACVGGYTPTPTRTFTPTLMRTSTYSPTSMPLRTRTLTSTPTLFPCLGDCNADGSVAVNEIIILVNIALGNAHISACPRGMLTEPVTVVQIIRAVDNVLNSCPAG